MLLIEVPEAIQRFGNWYNDTAGVPTAVTALHLVGLLGAGGLAIAADRAMLGTRTDDAGARATTLATVHATHRFVIGGLVLIASSGVAMALADLETFLASPAFWVKMGLVAALLANGTVMLRAERRAGDDVRSWGALRTTAAISLALWFALVVAGVVLVNSA